MTNCTSHRAAISKRPAIEIERVVDVLDASQPAAKYPAMVHSAMTTAGRTSVVTCR